MTQTPSTLQYALAYAQAGFACLPVWSVTPAGDKSTGCQCGKTPCTFGAGKHPVTHLAHSGSKSATTDPATLQAWFEGTGHNIGIAPQVGQVVLDVDFRVDGVEARWAELAPHVPPTLTVSTGQGLHLYFTCPPDARYRGKLEDGIDVKPAGQYVAAPPSMHWTGKQYAWIPGATTLAPLPEWLALQLQAEHRSTPHEQQGDWPDVCSAEQYAEALAWLKSLPPKTKAGPPNNERFNRVKELAKTGMSVDRILQCIEESRMLDGWHVPTDPDKLWGDADNAVNLYRSKNPLASPELLEQYLDLVEREVPKPATPASRVSRDPSAAPTKRERYTGEHHAALARKLTKHLDPAAKTDGQNLQALTKGLAVPPEGIKACAERIAHAYPNAGVDDYLRGGAIAASLQASDVSPEQFAAWHKAGIEAVALTPYTYTDAGEVECTLDNMVAVLRSHPEWQGVLRYNDFARRTIFVKEPPIPRHVRPNGDATGFATDQHTLWAQTWFERVMRMRPSDKLVHAAIETAANCDRYHPVLEYLDSLQWDGQPRLDTWLIDFAKTEDTKYTRALAACTLIAAVARVNDPGCKVDTILILEGPQGLRKSTLLKVLVGAQWFSDTTLDFNSKDAYQNLPGVWGYELAELAGLKRTDTERIKSFASSSVDRYRQSYGRLSESVPRQCVFFGTINPDGNGYLADPTGGRRFWPVTCGASIDVEGMAAARDQLWAEASARYHAGERWHLQDEAAKLATQQQADRAVQDPWATLVAEWVQSPAAAGEFTPGTVLDKACLVEPGHQTHPMSIRVGNLLAPLVASGLLVKRRAKVGEQKLMVYARAGHVAPVVELANHQRKP